jgi:HlyD family secretion protein
MTAFLLAAPLVLGAGAPLLPGGAAPAQEKVDRAAPASVAAFARLEPVSGLIALGAPSEDRVASVLVEEGAQVEKGAALCELASLPVRRAKAVELEKRVEDARAQRAAIAALGAARVRQGEAELARKDALAARAAGVERCALRVTELKLERARLDQARVASEATLASQSERDGARLSYEQAEAEVSRAQASLAELEAAREHDLACARLAIETAEAETARDLAALAILSLEADAAAAQAEVELSIVRAPIGGRILKVLARAGERSGPRALLLMGDTSRMRAIAEVDQTQIRWVREGQAAEISSPALAGPAKARVERVGALVFKNDVFGDDPTAATNARVVPVGLVIEEEGLVTRLTHLECEVRISVSSGGAKDER